MNIFIIMGIAAIFYFSLSDKVTRLEKKVSQLESLNRDAEVSDDEESGQVNIIVNEEDSSQSAEAEIDDNTEEQINKLMDDRIC